jgi:hypothetical protein
MINTVNWTKLSGFATAMAAAALIAAPATAHADPPPPPANCDQSSGDPACQPQGHYVTCGWGGHFPIMCWRPGPPGGAPPPPAPDAPAPAAP